MHLYWQDLLWDCYPSFFVQTYQSYGPWFMPKFRLHSIYFLTNLQNFTKFHICIHMTRSTLGLLHIIFHTFVPELWPLIYASISFPLNLENKWAAFHQILYMHSYWQDLCCDCNTSFFCTFVPELWPLIYAKISFPLNILRTNSQNFMLGLLHTIFADLYHSYGPWFTPEFRFRSISWKQMDIFWPNFI